jgi:hypothetical protein
LLVPGFVYQHQGVTTPTGSGTRTRRQLIALAVAGLLALAVFWYLTPNAAENVRSTHRTAAVVAARCPTTEAELQPWTSGDTSVQTGTLPPGFVPRSVMLCRIDPQGSDARSKPSYAIATTESAVSSDLLGALELPDQKFWFDGRGACTADAEARLNLLLLDAQRHAIRPAVPVDPCGKVRPELRSAITALPMIVTSRRTI